MRAAAAIVDSCCSSESIRFPIHQAGSPLRKKPIPKAFLIRPFATSQHITSPRTISLADRSLEVSLGPASLAPRRPPLHHPRLPTAGAWHQAPGSKASHPSRAEGMFTGGKEVKEAEKAHCPNAPFTGLSWSLKNHREWFGSRPLQRIRVPSLWVQSLERLGGL